MFTSKFFVRIIINLAVGLFLILIWLKFVSINEILDKLLRINPVSLLPLFFFLFLSSFLRAFRLKVFLSEIKKIKLLDLVFLTGVSQMLNFFIPIRAGELAKGVYLNLRYGIQTGKAIIWVFIDRLLDFLVVLLSAGLLLVIVPTSLSITAIKFIIIILTIALLLTYLAVFQLNFSKKLVRFLTPLFIEKHLKIYFVRFTSFILDSFSVLDRNPKDLLVMVLLTIFAYGSDAFIWYFGFVSLGAVQDYLKMYLGQLLSALTYLIPAAPGYVGSAEASGTLILAGVFGIDANLASAMIVLFHIASALFVIAFGLISTFSLKLDLGLKFRKALRKGD